MEPDLDSETEWNRENIRESIQDWKKSLERREHLLWFYHDDESAEPLDLKNPKLRITLEHLAGRNGFREQRVSIMTSERELYSGLMIDGTFEADVPDDIANLPDWKNPIFIGVGSAKHEIGIEFRSSNGPFDQFLLVASGRLRRGKLHGLIAINGILSYDPKSYCQNEVVNGLGFVGHFKDGVPHGVCWRGLVGGAWIYGLVDDDGHFTGDNIAYIYPDLKTALVGKFDRGLMIEGREAEVIGEQSDDETGIHLLQLTEPSGPVYHYDPPNSQSFGDQPLLGDPLDNRYILLKTSEKYPAAGEGAFARDDIPAGTVFCLFGGKVLTKEEGKKLKAEEFKRYQANQWTMAHPQVISDWKYRNSVSLCGLMIDIPGEFEDVDKFCGTLGHKLNHSFNPTSAFMTIDSARFGIINGVISLQSIAQGEEIFVSYGYSFDSAAPWYKDLFLEFMVESPNHPKVQQLGWNRSKEELLKSYEKYLKTIPGTDSSFADMAIGS